jgi:hypothetical protein
LGFCRIWCILPALSTPKEENPSALHLIPLGGFHALFL